VWGAFHGLGALYRDQGELKEAEKMYQRALAGKEKGLGFDHQSMFDTINDLRTLHIDQVKLKEAEEMLQRKLAGYMKAFAQM
jgi:tetratricopeptide (TPR) repeat protein